jgi:hypothetical protein
MADTRFVLGRLTSPTIKVLKEYGGAAKVDWMLILRIYSEPKVILA